MRTPHESIYQVTYRLQDLEALWDKQICVFFQNSHKMVKSALDYFGISKKKKKHFVSGLRGRIGFPDGIRLITLLKYFINFHMFPST